jgi:hypothetical protein
LSGEEVKERLLQMVEQGLDFAKIKGSQLAGEIVLYERISNSIYFIVAVTGMVVSIRIFLKYYRVMTEDKGFSSLSDGEVQTVLSAISSVGFAIMALAMLNDLILCFVSPDLTVLQFIRCYLK